MGLHHTFGKACRPRREQDVRRIVGLCRSGAPVDLGRGGTVGTSQEVTPSLGRLDRCPARDHGGGQIGKVDPRVLEHRRCSRCRENRSPSPGPWPAPRRRISAASAPLNLVLMGTRTAPARKSPSAATTHSALLNAQMETRSPGSIPEATRAAPNVRACPPAPRRSSGFPPSMSAGLDPNRSAAASIIEEMLFHPPVRPAVIGCPLSPLRTTLFWQESTVA